LAVSEETESEHPECSDERLAEEFALVNATVPAGTAFVLVAVAHDHGLHVMVENNLPTDTLLDLLDSVVLKERDA
jgi:hypothetical protein